MNKGIIIGGMQRSGTSFVRKLLGSHSCVELYPFDALFVRNIYTKYGDKVLSGHKLKSAVDKLYNLKKVKESVRVAENPSKEEVLSEVKKETSFLDILRCFLQLYCANREGSVWGFKTPRNEFWADHLLSEWTNTKFIHVLRDPRDVMASLNKYENINTSFSLNPFEHRTAELIDGRVEVWKNEWVKSFNKGIKNKKKYSERYEIIKYEELIKKPRQKAKQICELLKLDFEKEMLNLNAHPSWEGNNSSFSNHKQGIHKSSLNKYKVRLSKKEIYYVEKSVLSNIQSEYSFSIDSAQFAQKLPFVVYYLNDIISYLKEYSKSVIKYLVKRLKN